MVDWLSIEIVTQRFTNFQTVRRRLGDRYVTPLNKNSGGSASKFLFKFQDPKNWLDIVTLLQDLNAEYPFAEAPLIRTIEVSFDAYSRTATRDEMVDITHVFYRDLAKPVSENIRVSGTKEKLNRNPIWGASNRDIKKLLNEGRNICIGNIKHSTRGKTIPADSKYMQIYFKTTDNDGQPIPVEQHRARIEIRLEGKDLPFETLKEGMTFKFERLSKNFKMLKLNEEIIDNSPVTYRTAIHTLSQLGRMKSPAKRQYSLITLADTKLNDRVYDALRDLTRRMQKNLPKSGESFTLSAWNSI